MTNQIYFFGSGPNSFFFFFYNCTSLSASIYGKLIHNQPLWQTPNALQSCREIECPSTGLRKSISKLSIIVIEIELACQGQIWTIGQGQIELLFQ